MKVISEQSAWPRALVEVNALRSLENHNILRLESVIETSNALIIVSEFAEGGDLLRHMQDQGCRPLNEEQARNIFRQLVFAVDHIHRRGWIHRDIKCENILLSAFKDRIILADFGFAGRWQQGAYLTESLGSLHYSSPEIVNGQPYVGPEIDVWSLGVVLYAICTGRLPFGGKTEEEIADRIRSAQYTIPVGLSTPLRALITSILQPRAHERASIESIKRCDWLVGSTGFTTVLRSYSGQEMERRRRDRPRRLSVAIADVLKINLTKPAEAEDSDQRQEFAATEAGRDSQVSPPSSGEGLLTKLSRYTIDGVKRFTLSRLTKR